MPGPSPKHPSTRARRNKTTTAATLQSNGRAAPALPEREVLWHDMTLAWWSDIWASPMSPEWDDSDVHNVYILAALYDDIWRAETAKDRKEAAGEYRLQRKDLGLTPYDRRRLEWTIESADEAKDRGNQRRSRGSASTERKTPPTDPRAGLHAV